MFNPRNGLPAPPAWLETAIFYEIYPQTFYDSNGDGIGDVQGIVDKLDYIADLGANALWINPCFDSPFKDAGYDIRDYYTVAPRYGTNADLEKLFTEAHTRGIKVLLDLVPGHTSEQNDWFQYSCKAEPNQYSDRYIWTSHAFDNGDGLPFIGGEAPRNGTYILNFFKSQPALNYGFNKKTRPWQQSVDAPGPVANQEEMANIMRYWLDKGADGFRVDMADSLVKFDGEDKQETIKVWQKIFARFRNDYPEAAFVSEWGKPIQALKAGFDMDFYLDWRNNGYNVLARNTDDPLGRSEDLSFFKQSSGTSPQEFIDQYWPQYEQIRDLGYFSLISCNHDTPRLAPRLTDAERRLFFIFLLTMPGVPFIYYGDEIGMRYLDIPTKEGGYQRTGTRTPMQWDATKKNCGFSSAPTEELYLPQDTAADAPDAASQMLDPAALRPFVQKLIGLRSQHPELHADSDFSFLWAHDNSRILAYRRESSGGNRCAVALNAGDTADSITLESPATIIVSSGDARVEGNTVHLGPSSGAVVELA